MTRKLEPLPDFDPDEMERNIALVRGYLSSAGQHMLEEMFGQGIPHVAATVLTGSLEYAALMWMQTMLKAGTTRKDAREQAEREFRRFLIRHGKTVYDLPKEEPVN